MLPITIPSFSSLLVGFNKRTESPAYIGEPSVSRKGSRSSESASLSLSSSLESELSELWLLSSVLLLSMLRDEVLVLGWLVVVVR